MRDLIITDRSYNTEVILYKDDLYSQTIHNRMAYNALTAYCRPMEIGKNSTTTGSTITISNKIALKEGYYRCFASIASEGDDTLTGTLSGYVIDSEGSTISFSYVAPATNYFYYSPVFYVDADGFYASYLLYTQGTAFSEQHRTCFYIEPYLET